MIKNIIIERRILYIILFFYSLIFCFLLIFCNGTGDSGDSIMHFLFAKNAIYQPELFFNHWAKPLFVLIASPWCQFGFVGIQGMNLLCIISVAILTFKFAIRLNYSMPWVSLLVLVTSPIIYQLTLSGLTEPLFAFLLMLSFYNLEKRAKVSIIIISFLPFIRSEGLIISGMVFLYLIYIRKTRYILLLAIGHVVYSILGYYYHHDILWVFKEIPYLGFHSNYGNGNLIHFVKNMHKIIGFSNSIVLGLTILYLIYTFIKYKSYKKFLKIEYLIFSTTVIFFIFHTIAWAFGWFNSFGLLRVLIPIIPFFGLMMNKVLTSFETYFKWILFYFLITWCVTLIDQFYLRIEKYQLDNLQINDIQSFNFLKNKDLLSRSVYSHSPYFKMLLNQNPFQKNYSKENILSDNIRKYDLVIWDNWYSKVDFWIEERDIINTNKYKLIHSDSTLNKDSKLILNRIFERL